MHNTRLRDKILAAGSDFFSTHRGKEVVLVFNKDTGEALNIACNTESDLLQLFWCGKCSKRNNKIIKQNCKENINKLYTDWTVCDKAIRSAINFSIDCLP